MASSNYINDNKFVYHINLAYYIVHFDKLNLQYRLALLFLPFELCLATKTFFFSKLQGEEAREPASPSSIGSTLSKASRYPFSQASITSSVASKGAASIKTCLAGGFWILRYKNNADASNESLQQARCYIENPAIALKSSKSC